MTSLALQVALLREDIMSVLNRTVTADIWATAISKGDLVCENPDGPKLSRVLPFSCLADQLSLGDNQAYAHDWFMGVALEDADTAQGQSTVKLAVSGRFWFNCPSGDYHLDQLVGPKENVAGDALLDDTVVAVDSLTKAIGRVAQKALASTRVLVEIASTKMP